MVVTHRIQGKITFYKECRHDKKYVVVTHSLIQCTQNNSMKLTDYIDMTGGEKRDMVIHSIHKKAHENSPPKENTS